jgi:hypothetical protein
VANRTSLASSFSRGGLLVAALLYLAGATIDPLLHAYSADGRSGSSLAMAGGGYPDAPDERRAHTDAECLLCKLPGTALPAPLLAPLANTSEKAAALGTLGDRDMARGFLLPQPRAPPLV